MPLGDDNIDNISEKQLKCGIWFMDHRTVLKKALIIFLILINVWFWGYTFYGLFDYFIVSYNREKQAETQLVQGGINWVAINRANSPQPLAIGSPRITADRQATDFVIQIQNSNDDWLAVFHYSMILGEEIKTGEDFILPGTTKYLFNTFRQGRGAPNFAVNDVKWQRITTRQIEGDLVAFLSDRLNFSFDDIRNVPSAQNMPGWIEFQVINKSAYSFWQGRFIILLWRGDNLVGIDSVIMDRLQAGETRQASVSLLNHSSVFSKIEIVPDINVLDAGVFMPPS